MECRCSRQSRFSLNKLIRLKNKRNLLGVNSGKKESELFERRKPSKSNLRQKNKYKVQKSNPKRQTEKTRRSHQRPAQQTGKNKGKVTDFYAVGGAC